jgi:hypothetical protein
MIDKIDAINSLVTSCAFSISSDGAVTWLIPEVAPVSDAQINAELTRLQAVYQANEYQRNRAAEYPSFAEQFDTLYHGGYDAWKATIDSVKAKYPKP